MFGRLASDTGKSALLFRSHERRSCRRVPFLFETRPPFVFAARWTSSPLGPSLNIFHFLQQAGGRPYVVVTQHFTEETGGRNDDHSIMEPKLERFAVPHLLHTKIA
jgi:hypothetical protein